MSDKMRQAGAKGFKFTVYEKDKSTGKPKSWLCKCPRFKGVQESPCGLGKTQEEALEDCQKHMKAKKINEAVQPKKKAAKPAPKPEDK
ncbi:MAG: hypothetical protein ACTSRU_02145 [Candidatus Hodarchaeales archaeon]